MALANMARQTFVPNTSGRALQSATIPTLPLCSSLGAYLLENTVRTGLYIIVAFRPSIWPTNLAITIHSVLPNPHL
jgi:hypothetical protein